MTDQQTIDNNKLIAEFMHYKHDEKPMAYMAANYKKLYHTDWNWLMPVVEKIVSSKNKTTLYHPYELYKVELLCYSMRSNTFVYEIDVANSTAIKATYQAVVEFIIWYNKKGK